MKHHGTMSCKKVEQLQVAALALLLAAIQAELTYRCSTSDICRPAPIRSIRTMDCQKLEARLNNYNTVRIMYIYSGTSDSGHSEKGTLYTNDTGYSPRYIRNFYLEVPL